ncbi:MAG TPA: gamma-glutamyl-gamma-aminobutyrate hydrolase family protein [Terriglobales bacterium]|nr:gamma-glutamyl-gamma-aminobutyrate hydrolase family protein [Terriglobales bacterium]
MRPRIAIPIPHSDEEYVDRSLPQYERAIEQAGGESVRIPLESSPAAAMKWIEPCDGVLLPGSKADVEPAKYGLPRHPKTAAADVRRDNIDQMLLQDAYNLRKPVLGICYGLQILNVYRRGTLIQHIESAVNHAAGRKVETAHTVEVEPQSKLSEILAPGIESPEGGGRQPKSTADLRPGQGKIIIPVNSSHHQSADRIGEGLRIVARCPEDGIIEALEGTSPDHFVLAVQWHPERSAAEDGASRALFRAFVSAARDRQAELERGSVTKS